MSASHAHSGKTFWLLGAAGWGVMIFGITGLLSNATLTHPGNFALWFVGSALAHDALLAPVVFLTAVALTRVVPARIRPVLQRGLIAAGMVTAVSLPFVLGKGGAPGNASALPRNYPAGLAIVLGIVALATALGAWRRSRSQP